MVTAQLHLSLWLFVSAAIPIFPLNVSMTCTGTNLPLTGVRAGSLIFYWDSVQLAIICVYLTSEIEQ